MFIINQPKTKTMKNLSMSKTKILMALAIGVLVIIRSSAIGQSITFEKTYNYNPEDGVWCVQQTLDGGYVFSGWTGAVGLNSGQYDVVVTKTDAYGNQLWNKTIGGSSEWDMGRFIQQTSDSGYIIVGDTGITTWNSDIYLIKMDVNGNVQWSKTWGGVNPDYGHCVRQTFDGGYIIAGQVMQSGYQMNLTKTDAGGNISWNTNYYAGEMHSVRQTSDSGYIAMGFSGAIGAGSCDVILLKVDKNGTQQWVKTYGAAGYDWAKYVVQTLDGGYAFVGGLCASMSTGCGIHLIKVDNVGTILWDKTAGFESIDLSMSNLEQTTDSGFVFTGSILTSYTVPFDTTHTSDLYVIRTDKNGDTLWTKSVGDTSDERGYFIEQTTDKGFIVAGYKLLVQNISSWKPDIYLVKLDSMGSQNSITGIKTKNYSGASVNVYPNPANDHINCKIFSSVQDIATVDVVDVLGRKILSETKDLLTGENEFDLNVADISRGMYVVRLQTGLGTYRVLKEVVVK